MSASTTASVSQAYEATLTSQDSSPTKNTRPHVSASENVSRGRFPQMARISSAGPTAARGQKPTGGKAPASARPAARAARSDHQPPRPGQRAAPPAGAPAAPPGWGAAAGPKPGGAGGGRPPRAARGGGGGAPGGRS